MVKDKENVEVSMVFNVKVFGKMPRKNINPTMKHVRERLALFEMEFNRTHLLRMHVNEGDPL